MYNKSLLVFFCVVTFQGFYTFLQASILSLLCAQQHAGGMALMSKSQVLSQYTWVQNSSSPFNLSEPPFLQLGMYNNSTYLIRLL